MNCEHLKNSEFQQTLSPGYLRAGFSSWLEMSMVKLMSERRYSTPMHSVYLKDGFCESVWDHLGKFQDRMSRFSILFKQLKIDKTLALQITTFHEAGEVTDGDKVWQVKDQGIVTDNTDFQEEINKLRIGELNKDVPEELIGKYLKEKNLARKYFDVILEDQDDIDRWSEIIAKFEMPELMTGEEDAYYHINGLCITIAFCRLMDAVVGNETMLENLRDGRFLDRPVPNVEELTKKYSDVDVIPARDQIEHQRSAIQSRLPKYLFIFERFSTFKSADAVKKQILKPHLQQLKNVGIEIKIPGLN